MSIRRLILVSFAIGCSLSTFAASERALSVADVLGGSLQLQGNQEGYPYTAVHDEVLNRIMELDRATDAAWLEAAKGGLEVLKAKQDATRRAWVDSFGGFPERCDLNARVTGVFHRDAYRIEKTMFESRPAHHVTATVYVPEDDRFKAPYPAVAVACGHSFTGKNYPNYQRPGVIGAKNGFVVIIYDPIDQGERRQRRDADGKKSMTTAGHNSVGYRAMLLGWNTAQFRIWDGMRAIDYLLSRADVDAKRIAVTGHSGGGTESAYLMALDERVSAACPSGFITSVRELDYLCGPQDAEQKFFGQLAYGLNHLGLLMLRADRCAEMPLTTHADFFPFMGATDTRDRARTAFAAIGRAEAFDFVHATGPHLWPESSMQAEFRWFRKWLKGETAVWKGYSPIEEQKINVGFSYSDPAVDTGLMRENESEQNVTKTGHVVDLPGERTAYDIMRDELGCCQKDRKALDRETITRLTGLRDLSKIDVSPLDRRERTLTLGAVGVKVVETILHRSDDGILLPLTCFIPSEVSGSPVMIVAETTKGEELAPRVEELLKAGRSVAVAELRQFGRTGGIWRRHGEISWNEGRFYGNPHADEMTAVMAERLGESLIGRRTEDLILATESAAEILDSKAPFALEAEGRAAIPAAHGYYLNRARFASIALRQAPLSWSALFEDDTKEYSFADIVHGALRVYDWVDLVK